MKKFLTYHGGLASFIQLHLWTQICALSVVQWQDSMQILPDNYLDLQNSNTASLLTDEDTALRQTFSVDLNNNFINTLFDVIVFDNED